MTTRPWTAANSAAPHAILPRVAKQCGMPVIRPSLVYKRTVNPLAAGDIRHQIGNNTHAPQFSHNIRTRFDHSTRDLEVAPPLPPCL
jgi:hypothetical protein